MTRQRGLAALIVSALVLAACGTSGADAPAASTGARVAIGAGLEGPDGLRASVYAAGLAHVAAFAFDSDGRLWVATAAYEDEGDDAVYVVATEGAAPVKVIAEVHTPLGLLWVDDTLYVSSNERVDAYRGFDGAAFSNASNIVTFPAGVGENNGLARAPDGRIVLGISAPCDACDPESEYSGAIVSFAPDGTDLRVEASELRAPVGLAYFPGTSDLYVTMNQRDDLGAETPGDWLAVVASGTTWGFPECYGQDAAACADVPERVAELDPHGAAGGVAIVTGELGKAVGTAALVAEWAGAGVVRVPLEADGATTVAAPQPFLTGLENPVAVVLGPDGALYAGDWATGTVYRVAAA